MLEAITFVAIIVLLLAVIVSFVSLKRSSNPNDKILRIFLFLFFGSVAASLDFIVEFKGTSFDQWSYSKSVLLIGGLIPVELPVMFFSFGIIMAVVAITPLRFDEAQLTRVSIQPSVDYFRLAVLALLFAIGASGYFLLGNVTALIFAVPAGLFGYDITLENDRRRAIYFGLVAMISDIIFENFVIGLAGYDYSGGFTLDVPLEYFLLAVAGFGLANVAYYRLFPVVISDKK
ncbi:MAG: hypothetical protein ACFFD4_03595 [Candidatus Odinarchaeota archaeon]